MKLQTQIPLKKQERQIDYSSKLLLLGSCFAENMGSKFNYFKFQTMQNPFGILFHPKAIETLVFRSIDEKEYTENDVFSHNDQWHCYDAHSKLSDVSKERLLQKLNAGAKTTKKQILEATHVFITLGTAWVYDLAESGKTVANCHKVTQNHFNKKLLSIDDITKSLRMMIDVIQSVNKDVSIVFTVSPVRHIKDGFVENTQSKSHLIGAIHSVLSSEAESKGCSYFPSYEIMLDELRDYRFYKPDMLHPNETAVDYIWEKFKQVWIAMDAHKTMAKVVVIQKGLAHKPFNPESDAHLEFFKQLNMRKRELSSQFPHITF